LGQRNAELDHSMVDAELKSSMPPSDLL